MGGLGIVENAYDQTMLVEGMAAAAIESREPELLALACEHMPRLCVDALDVLLLDETGKNISGTGMDTNIVGRVLNPTCKPSRYCWYLGCILPRECQQYRCGQGTASRSRPSR